MNRIKHLLKSIIIIPAVIIISASLSCGSCDDDTHKKHHSPSTDPQLGYSVPDKGAHEVSTSKIIDITFYFNRPMDGDTINIDTFTVKKEGGSSLSGAVSYNGEADAAVFTPDSVLAPGTYTATLKQSIRYKTGGSLEADYVWLFTTGPRYWTIMIYLDGDNNLEGFMMDDINEMMQGYEDLQGYDLILLVDRIDGFSSDDSTLGDDFNDTRLYRITNNFYTRLNGGAIFPDISRSSAHEANMGDARTLEVFVRFCKANYRADNYALILWNHGDGVRGGDFTIRPPLPDKAICQDETDSGDKLYSAEISDILSYDHSVDLLGFDACLMGGIETGYQYRPSSGGFGADYMVASPPNEWSAGWKYDNIFSRINKDGGTNDELDTTVGNNISKETIFDPASMTARQLCGVIVEEQRDSAGESMYDQALSCYDLSRSGDVKSAVDAMAVSLKDCRSELEETRGSGSAPTAMNYFEASNEREWLYVPYFDLYDLCYRIKNAAGKFDGTITGAGGYADDVLTAVDGMVIYSFAGDLYDLNAAEGSFINGKNGISIFCPDGDRLYQNGTDPHWYYQWWYNSIDIDESVNDGYGKLSWCADGAGSIGTVENWFELLDSWFDTPGVPGLNGYQY